MILKRFLLILLLLNLFFPAEVFSKQTSVVLITRKSEQKSTRIVLEFDELNDFNLIPDMERRRLLLHIPNASIRITADRLLEDERISMLTSTNSNDGVTAYVTIKKYPFSFHYFVLDNPPRIVLDIKERDRSKVFGVKGKEELVPVPEPKQESKSEKIEPSMLEEAKAIYRSGLRKFAVNDYLGAVKELQPLAIRFQGSRYAETASYIIAEAYQKLAPEGENYNELALDAYRVAISSYSDNYRREASLFKMGNIYLKKGFKIEAKATFQILVDDFPKGLYAPRALMARSSIYSDQGRYKEAYNDLEKVLFLYPFSPVVRGATFRIADAYYNENEFEKAAEIYSSALNKWPSFPKANPDTLFYMSETFYKVGELEKAKILFYQMLNLYPDLGRTPTAVSRLGDIYKAQGRVSQSLKLYATSVAMFPASETVTARMKMAHMGFKKEGSVDKDKIFNFASYINPETEFKETLEQYPEAEEAKDALFGVGKILQRQSRFIEATDRFEELLSTYPDSEIAKKGKEELRSIFFNLVSQYHSQDGFFEVLILYYDRFEQFFQEVDNPEILYEIGDSYSQMGLNEKALKLFDNAAKKDTKKRMREETLFSQGKAFYKLRRYEEAGSIFRKQLKLYKNGKYSVDVKVYLGDVFMAQKKTANAYKFYSSAVNKIRDKERKAEVYAKMGQGQHMRKRYNSATKDYRKALAELKVTPPSEKKEMVVADLKFKIFEALFQGGRFKEVVKLEEVLKKVYPNDDRTSWATYMAAESLRKLKREKPSEKLLAQLSESDAGLMQEVASVEANYMKWKQENPDLFQKKKKTKGSKKKK